ncbi:FUSC family protein [Nonomuraea terrae]|uniref:FUSC family protein n=1 Tax=Nonomuraea terrae TaxID=2530383 RepID=UPI0037AF960E
MPVRSALRLRPLGDIWHKHAVSAVVALALAMITLYALDRLDLVLYAAGGGMCALYAHGLPYAARARALAGVVAGMTGSVAVGLVTAALTDSVAVRVLVAALLAGLHKAACDATRIGPPGNVVLTFITAGAVFVPEQRLADVPLHVGIGLVAGAVAWLVGMSPWLVRPDGPERVAVARALEATARLLRARARFAAADSGGKDGGRDQSGVSGDGRSGGPPQDALLRARHDAAAAVNAAWQTLLRAGAPRDGLRRVLVRAESAAAGSPALAVDADTFTTWAYDLRKGRPLPEPPPGDALTAATEQAELAGMAAEHPSPRRATAVRTPRHTDAGRLRRARDGVAAEETPAVAPRRGPRVRRGTRALGARATGAAAGVARATRSAVSGMRPGVRTIATVTAGSAAAGWLSMGLGVGRPYWAVVTAAAVFAANTTLSWSRALQRTVGNLLGVALFTLLVPVSRLGALALIVTVLVLQFVTEAAVTRNYWLGSAFIAPMAMLMTEFAGVEPVREMVADRWLDTCLGAAAGLLVCALLPDRGAARRVHDALDRLERLVAGLTPPAPLASAPAPSTGYVTATATSAAGPFASDAGRRAACDRLRASLVELREAADTAAGEWWSTELPQERIAAAERTGHHRLAELTTTRRPPLTRPPTCAHARSSCGVASPS